MIRNIFISLLISTALFSGPTVTYEQAGGRLGDHLISYLHAKWISYQYGIPLAYTPFLFSDAFALSELEVPLEAKKKLVPVTNLSQLNRLEDKIYQIPYVTECPEEYLTGHPFWKERPFILVDWNDREFIEWVRPCLAPRIPVSPLSLPKDQITVALHIRRPYGQDADPNIHRIFPYKFLPDQFYIDQLNWIYEEMGRQPLYVYIFSNDPARRKIAHQFQAKLKNKNVTFDFPKVLDESREGVISDLFSMMEFDCIIRPESNLSIVASKFGKQQIVISPEHVIVNTRENIVDRVKIERR